MRKLETIKDFHNLEKGSKLHRIHKGDTTPYTFVSMHPLTFYDKYYFIVLQGSNINKAEVFQIPKSPNDIWIFQEDKENNSVIKEELIKQLERRIASIKKIYK